MTESIMIVLIKCITVAFCVFTFGSVFLSIMKYAVNKSNEDEYLTREEFEEYEHMISDGLAENHKLIKEIKDKIQEKR